MSKITPFLWFQDHGEEAIAFYTTVFKNAKVMQTTRYGDEVPGPKGKVMSATLEIEGQQFMVLNGGPAEGFTFSPAISFFVSCETQAEIDELWEKLTEGGRELQCGWLTDKYGITWQIVPAVLGDLVGGPDPVKAKRATAAMLKMIKLDIAALQKAYDGE
jgi:predicted 3-demethylubiquinone-9 3-methyltransferase (glyoxalase superfamily)